MMRRLFLLFCLAIASLSSGSAYAITPGEAFARLKTLVGEWEGTSKEGRTFRVSFKLSARESILLETWTLGPGRESLTVYHLDRDDLIATHYCPIGNQPRLRLVSPAEINRFAFEFVSATNLPDPAAAHQHSFEIEIATDGSFSRSEIYHENGKGDAERTTFIRQR